MTDLYLNWPPPEGQRIETIHAWICTQEDGSEGIMSADMPGPPGMLKRHIPLLSSQRHLAEAFLPLVDRLVSAARSQTGSKLTARLVTYVMQTEPSP